MKVVWLIHFIFHRLYSVELNENQSLKDEIEIYQVKFTKKKFERQTKQFINIRPYKLWIYDSWKYVSVQSISHLCLYRLQVLSIQINAEKTTETVYKINRIIMFVSGFITTIFFTRVLSCCLEICRKLSHARTSWWNSFNGNQK